MSNANMTLVRECKSLGAEREERGMLPPHDNLRPRCLKPFWLRSQVGAGNTLALAGAAHATCLALAGGLKRPH